MYDRPFILTQELPDMFASDVLYVHYQSLDSFTLWDV